MVGVGYAIYLNSLFVSWFAVILLFVLLIALAGWGIGCDYCLGIVVGCALGGLSVNSCDFIDGYVSFGLCGLLTLVVWFALHFYTVAVGACCFVWACIACASCCL